MFRVDQLVAALARKHALADRRLLRRDHAIRAGAALRRALTASTSGCSCPVRSDIPVLRPLSRAGYRPLLEAGVRVFEWNGSMLHAKTAVADGQMGAGRIDEPEHRQLDGQSRARRDHRGRAVRETDGRDVSRRSGQRDGSRAGCTQPGARAWCAASRRQGGGDEQRRAGRRPGRCGSAAPCRPL